MIGYGSVSRSKAALRSELERLLEADLARREAAHRSAIEGATHEEAKPENDKDTRALEQSYLARGEAARVEELRQGLTDVRAMALRAFQEGDPAALGALVTVSDDPHTWVLWLVPYGGGMRLDGGTVQAVTPKSPLGRAILGKAAGDACEMSIGGRERELSIEAVE
jgi:transcription elongation GreA/GreB family factor